MTEIIEAGGPPRADVSPVVRLVEVMAAVTFFTGLVVVATHDEPAPRPTATASPTPSSPSPTVAASVHPSIYRRRVAAAERTARFVATQICDRRDPLTLRYTRVIERDATKILVAAVAGARTEREGGFEILVTDLPGAVSYTMTSHYGTCQP